MTSTLQDFQVDHLCLLVGENPLPSYVAAKTLIKAGGTPHLVYTKHTKIQADRLGNLLKERSPVPDLQKCQYIPLDNYESDGYHIQKRVWEAIQPYAQQQLGLNYTGGTKPMAAHAHRALLKLQPNAVFSYLDPRRLEICIDREDGDRVRRKVDLKLSLEELFWLHHLAFQSVPVAEPKLSEVAKAFVHVACQQDWSKWKAAMQLEGLSEEVRASLEPYADESLGAVSVATLQKKGKFDQSSESTAKHWIEHNAWFEHYVLHQVQSVADACDIHESKASFHIKDLNLTNRRSYSKNQQDPDKRFEIDVAFMQNYQLFALSCTTSKGKAEKQKLFEVYLRARQLGGDEARAALVCFSEEPEVLEYELAMVLDNPNIKVFGKAHLLNLAQEIEDWIEQGDWEAK